jgi:flagellin FlaB
MGKKRGIVGIEAAIVLIAFVIVAAALAFVALNMGLFTTQKAKETISQGLGEASTALEVDGYVVGISNGTTVNTVSIPIRTSAGVSSVDLAPSRTSIDAIVGNQSFENIYKAIFYVYPNGTLAYANNGTLTNLTTDFSTHNLTADIESVLGIPSTPTAYVVIIQNINYNSVLETGEKAVVLIDLGNNALGPYGQLSVEIRPPEGAPLTVERNMPANIPAGAVNLG